MSIHESPTFPILQPQEVRVFLAEDDAKKIESISHSLAHYGLADSMTFATTLDEAVEFVDAQVPHALDANVFLLTGSLSPHFRRFMQDGNIVASILYRRFLNPLLGVANNAHSELLQQGLTSDEIEAVVSTSGLREIAKTQLQSEALIAGISRNERGAIREVAQIPITDFGHIGSTVLRAVVPSRLSHSRQ